MRSFKDKIRVLIIEDNEANMYLATFLLESDGRFEIFQAVDGTSGLKAARDEKPGLLLLDIQLPDMDGYQIARELKADPEMRHMHIIALTAFAMPGDDQKAYDAGCDGFLTKPINPDTFIDSVIKLYEAG